MMEIYLNIIEFAPNVYGIPAAAEHFFGRRPGELNLAECFFLATLLPRPLVYSRVHEKGQLSESWMKNLRQLMQVAAKNGKISPAELAEGLSQTVTFHKP